MASMLAMATSRLFRNGHSPAVRIPAELACARCDLELEIERVGDDLRIRPAGKPISGALAALASFSPDVLAADRGDQQLVERENCERNGCELSAAIAAAELAYGVIASGDQAENNRLASHSRAELGQQAAVTAEEGLERTVDCRLANEGWWQRASGA